MTLYKILRPQEWHQLRRDGHSLGAPVDLADGYVHLSTAAQLSDTLSKHFTGEGELMLLACDAGVMAPDLRWEPARRGDLFPHLYRALTLADILWSRPLPLGPQGHEIGEL